MREFYDKMELQAGNKISLEADSGGSAQRL
jgi:hypothetical protein